MPALEYPHITHTAGDVARLERLPRIRIAMIVMDHVGRGWSGEEILRQYPHLTPAEVHSALAYYYDHTAEIDAEIAEELATLETTDQRPTGKASEWLRTAKGSVRTVAGETADDARMAYYAAKYGVKP